MSLDVVYKNENGEDKDGSPHDEEGYHENKECAEKFVVLFRHCA